VTSHLSLFPVTKNVTRYICHISGKNVMLSHTKIYFLTCDVFCHILPEKRHIVAPPVQKKFEECDDSAGTGTWFSLPVSNLSLISEAWSGKAIWAKTDPKERSEPDPNIKGKRSLESKIWKSVILWHFQISQCHTFELCDILRFLLHGIYSF